MLHRFMRVFVMLGCGLLLATGVAVGQQKPKKNPFDASGKIAGFQNGLIQMKTATDQTWYIKMVPLRRVKKGKGKDAVFVVEGTHLNCVGTAELDFLRRGMFVRFTANFDKRGKTSDTINAMELFSPDAERKVGATKEEDGGLAADSKTASYLVGGQIVSYKSGKLTVSVGGKRIVVVVAEDATVNVAVADPSVVKVGDGIDVKGHYFKKPGVFAREVTIQLSAPLTGSKSKKKTRKKKVSPN
jgi:hypothetical protein